MGNLYDSLCLDMYEEDEMYSNYLEEIVNKRDEELEHAKRKLKSALEFIYSKDLKEDWRKFNEQKRA